MADDTPIYARAGELEVAIGEDKGVPVARMVYWPVMQSEIAGRSASLTADPDAPVPTRETVICRGGQHEGRKLSSMVGYPRLLVRDRVGPGHACDYVRTDETNDGMAVFEHVAHEARHN